MRDFINWFNKEIASKLALGGSASIVIDAASDTNYYIIVNGEKQEILTEYKDKENPPTNAADITLKQLLIEKLNMSEADAELTVKYYNQRLAGAIFEAMVLNNPVFFSKSADLSGVFGSIVPQVKSITIAIKDGKPTLILECVFAIRTVHDLKNPVPFCTVTAEFKRNDKTPPSFDLQESEPENFCDDELPFKLLAGQLEAAKHEENAAQILFDLFQRALEKSEKTLIEKTVLRQKILRDLRDWGNDVQCQLTREQLDVLLESRSALNPAESGQPVLAGCDISSVDLSGKKSGPFSGAVFFAGVDITRITFDNFTKFSRDDGEGAVNFSKVIFDKKTSFTYIIREKADEKPIARLQITPESFFKAFKKNMSLWQRFKNNLLFPPVSECVLLINQLSVTNKTIDNARNKTVYAEYKAQCARELKKPGVDKRALAMSLIELAKYYKLPEDLSNMDWTNADFSGLDLSHVNFRKSKLDFANFNSATISVDTTNLAECSLADVKAEMLTIGIRKDRFDFEEENVSMSTSQWYNAFQQKYAYYSNHEKLTCKLNSDNRSDAEKFFLAMQDKQTGDERSDTVFAFGDFYPPSRVQQTPSQSSIIGRVSYKKGVALDFSNKDLTQAEIEDFRSYDHMTLTDATLNAKQVTQLVRGGKTSKLKNTKLLKNEYDQLDKNVREQLLKTIVIQTPLTEAALAERNRVYAAKNPRATSVEESDAASDVSLAPRVLGAPYSARMPSAESTGMLHPDQVSFVLNNLILNKENADRVYIDMLNIQKLEDGSYAFASPEEGAEKFISLMSTITAYAAIPLTKPKTLDFSVYDGDLNCFSTLSITLDPSDKTLKVGYKIGEVNHNQNNLSTLSAAEKIRACVSAQIQFAELNDYYFDAYAENNIVRSSFEDITQPASVSGDQVIKTLLGIHNSAMQTACYSATSSLRKGTIEAFKTAKKMQATQVSTVHSTQSNLSPRATPTLARTNTHTHTPEVLPAPTELPAQAATPRAATPTPTSAPTELPAQAATPRAATPTPTSASTELPAPAAALFKTHFTKSVDLLIDNETLPNIQEIKRRADAEDTFVDEENKLTGTAYLIITPTPTQALASPENVNISCQYDEAKTLLNWQVTTKKESLIDGYRLIATQSLAIRKLQYSADSEIKFNEIELSGIPDAHREIAVQAHLKAGYTKVIFDNEILTASTNVHAFFARRNSSSHSMGTDEFSSPKSPTTR